MNTPNHAEQLALQHAVDASISPFSSHVAFSQFLPMAELLARSTIIHESFHGNPANCMLAIEIANRQRVPVMSLAQNLQIINGRPAWSGKYVIATINSCGRFEPLQYEFFGEKGSHEYGCRAWTRLAGTDIRIQGVDVTFKMVMDAGWLLYDGSPWISMPDLMYRYRAASFFSNVNAPEILMGLPTVEEAMDVFKSASSDARRSPHVATSTASKIASLTTALRSVPQPPAPQLIVVAPEISTIPSTLAPVDNTPEHAPLADADQSTEPAPLTMSNAGPQSVKSSPAKTPRKRAPKAEQSAPVLPPSLFDVMGAGMDDDCSTAQQITTVDGAACTTQTRGIGKSLENISSTPQQTGVAACDQPATPSDADENTVTPPTVRAAAVPSVAPAQTEEAVVTPSAVSAVLASSLHGRPTLASVKVTPAVDPIDQSTDLATIKQLCMSAETASSVAEVAARLPTVLEAERVLAETEVIETAMICLVDETTVEGMKHLSSVATFLSTKNLHETFRAAYNGRCGQLNAKKS